MLLLVRAVLSVYLLVDTGASRHLCARREWFSSLRQLQEDVSIRMGDATPHMAAAIGTVTIRTVVKGVKYEVDLHDVLFMPTMACNLISAGALDDILDIHIS